MTSNPKSSPAPERRDQPRQATNLRTVVMIDARAMACQVVNLSRTGALVSAPALVRLEQILTLEIPGHGPALCRVLRVTSTHFAVVFEPPLPDSPAL